MTRKLATIDRLIIFLFGAICLGCGLWLLGIYFNLPFAHQLSSYIDFTVWENLSQQGWYSPVLGAVLVFSGLFGILLLMANMSSNSFSQLSSPASTTAGAISLDISQLAEAITTTMEELPQVERAHHRVAYDRNRPTVRWNITVQSNAHIPTLTHTLEEQEQDFRAAVGDLDIDTTYRVYLLPAENPSS